VSLSIREAFELSVSPRILLKITPKIKRTTNYKNGERRNNVLQIGKSKSGWDNSGHYFAALMRRARALAAVATAIAVSG